MNLDPEYLVKNSNLTDEQKKRVLASMIRVHCKDCCCGTVNDQLNCIDCSMWEAPVAAYGYCYAGARRRTNGS